MTSSMIAAAAAVLIAVVYVLFGAAQLSGPEPLPSDQCPNAQHQWVNHTVGYVCIPSEGSERGR